MEVVGAKVRCRIVNEVWWTRTIKKKNEKKSIYMYTRIIS